MQSCQSCQGIIIPGYKFVHHFDCGECNLSYNKAHAKPMVGDCLAKHIVPKK